jgi:hypothetical protein
MGIFNSEKFENIRTANKILNVATLFILSLVGNFKFNERVLNFHPNLLILIKYVMKLNMYCIILLMKLQRKTSEQIVMSINPSMNKLNTLL